MLTLAGKGVGVFEMATFADHEKGGLDPYCNLEQICLKEVIKWLHISKKERSTTIQVNSNHFEIYYGQNR